MRYCFVLQLSGQARVSRMLNETVLGLGPWAQVEAMGWESAYVRTSPSSEVTGAFCVEVGTILVTVLRKVNGCLQARK